MHCCVYHMFSRRELYLTAIYRSNDAEERQDLWNFIKAKTTTTNAPWLLLGDFNHLLELDDRIGGMSVTNVDIKDFQDCLNTARLQDMNQKGCRYTQTNKQEYGDRIFSKLDHVLVNNKWITNYPTTETLFLTEEVFDHCPGLIKFFEMPTLGDAHSNSSIYGPTTQVL